MKPFICCLLFDESFPTYAYIKTVISQGGLKSTEPAGPLNDRMRGLGMVPRIRVENLCVNE